MKYILLTLLLTGCAVSVPVTGPFPDALAELMAPCPKLEKIENTEENRKLSVYQETVTRNYQKYQECSVNNEGWVEWYTKQKEIFEKLK